MCVGDIDLTAALILNVVKDKRLWKTKIHEALVEQYPDSEVSLQTVGRRVEMLAKDELLDVEIMRSEETRREFIVGYKATGEAVRFLQDAFVCTDHSQVIQEENHLCKVKPLGELLEETREDTA